MLDVLLNRRFIFLMLAFVFLAVFPYLHSLPFFSSFIASYHTFYGMRFALWLIILMGLNLLIGYSGQISLGHAAFVAIGAYIAAILMVNYSVPVFAAVFIAAVATGFIGFLIGIPALRLSGPYLAIATLAMIIVLPQILKHDRLEPWTHGAMGINVGLPHVPASLKDLATDDQWLYYVCMVPALIMTAMAWSITRSRIGRAFVAIRDSEIGAQQMGVNVSLYKMTAFGLSALYAGAGGALYVFTLGYLGPAEFDILLSLTLLVMIVLGGLGSVSGTIFAAIIMTIRNPLTDFLVAHVPAGETIGIDQTRGALFGILLILSMIFTPKGIAGNIEKSKEENHGEKIRELFSRLRRRSRPEGDSA